MSAAVGSVGLSVASPTIGTLAKLQLGAGHVPQGLQQVRQQQGQHTRQMASTRRLLERCGLGLVVVVVVANA